MTQLIKDIKSFCLDNYEAGFDTCIECWDTDDYAEFIADHNITSVAEFAKAYQPSIDYANEIKATAF